MLCAAVKRCSGMDGGRIAPSGRAWDGGSLAFDGAVEGAGDGVWLECKLVRVGVGVVSVVEGSSAFNGTCRLVLPSVTASAGNSLLQRQHGLDKGGRPDADVGNRRQPGLFVRSAYV